MRKFILFIFLFTATMGQAEKSPSDLMTLSQTDSSISFAYCLGYYDATTKDVENSDLIQFLDDNSKSLGAKQPFSKMPSFKEGQQDALNQGNSVQTQLFCTGLVQGTVEAMQIIQENKTTEKQFSDSPEQKNSIDINLSYCLGYYATASGRGETFSTLVSDQTQGEGSRRLMEEDAYLKGVEDANKEHNPNLLMQCMDVLAAYIDQLQAVQLQNKEKKE